MTDLAWREFDVRDAAAVGAGLLIGAGIGAGLIKARSIGRDLTHKALTLESFWTA